jgi:hypothetical protein
MYLSFKDDMSIISILGIIIILIITILNTENISILGQAPYLNTKTVKVLPATNSTANAFCTGGDGIISGGYSLGFTSLDAPFNTSITSNRPVQEVNETGYFEGWETSLVNRGYETGTLSASTLCLNLTLTP